MHILCATDFSAHAKQAADVAASFAARMKLPLHLIHCVEDWPVSAGDLPVLPPSDDVARKELTMEAQRLQAPDIKVTTELLHGNAAFETAASASDGRTKLLVIGPAEQGVLARVVTGSVAGRAASSLRVPMLIVRDAQSLLAWLNEEALLNVLCGVDFSQSADAATAYVKELGLLGRLKVEAAYVARYTEEIETAEARANLQRDVWDRLRPLLGDWALNVNVTGSVHPAEEFLKIATKQKCSLVVVGAPRRPGWKRLLKPSFSRAVIFRAETNVLCVPQVGYAPDFKIPVIQRILVATDFSAIGDDSLRHAYSLIPSGGDIRLMHVCQPLLPGADAMGSGAYLDTTPLMEEVRLEAEERLKKLPVERLATSGVSLSFEVVEKYDVAHAICEAAERFGADAICIGTHGHSRIGTALLGSTVLGVLAHAHQPVFVVTPPRD